MHGCFMDIPDVSKEHIAELRGPAQTHKISVQHITGHSAVGSK